MELLGSLCAVLAAVFEAVTLAIHLKDVDVMGQTIQQRTGKAF